MEHHNLMGATDPNSDAPATPLDTQIIAQIRTLNTSDGRILQIIKDCSGGTRLTDRDQVMDGVVYSRGQVEVPADDTIKMVILASRHNSRLAGHPGRAWTLALVRRCFTWPSMKKFVNRYVDGCKSCQRAKTSTQAPFGTLELLPIPAGQWTDVSNNLITDLPKSNGFDSILTVFDRLTKMAHFTPCEKAMSAEGLADLMLRNVWRLHRTPKYIISDCGSIFISQITKGLSQRLGIRLQPSTDGWTIRNRQQGG
jgi:hypothetical protein